jgi:hypothetical protein
MAKKAAPNNSPQMPPQKAPIFPHTSYDRRVVTPKDELFRVVLLSRDGEFLMSKPDFRNRLIARSASGGGIDCGQNIFRHFVRFLFS